MLVQGGNTLEQSRGRSSSPDSRYQHRALPQVFQNPYSKELFGIVPIAHMDTIMLAGYPGNDPPVSGQLPKHRQWTIPMANHYLADSWKAKSFERVPEHNTVTFLTQETTQA